ncbi:hypothetical protein F4861DRAFT_524893 [Xylaria intraflava]|nr:hypothetical protein F4861DRAFT_524893 [Xylaria intraflava]
MAGWAPNSWPQRPLKTPCPAHSYHSPNHQQYAHFMYEHLLYSPQSPNYQQACSAPSSYPISPHIPRTRTFPSYNHPPPRYLFPNHPAALGCITGHPKGPQYTGSRRANRKMLPAHECASILGVELEEPEEPLPNGALLLEKLSRQEGPSHIPHQDLLDMFQYLYGSMLKSVERIVEHWLRDKVTCKGAVRRFDERKGWKVCDSRLLVEGENFFCAPYIEVVFANLPHLTTIRELIELIRTHCLPREEHMQPAYKFKDRESSWKFEPGVVYLTVDAEHLIAKPVIRQLDHGRTGHHGGQRGSRHHYKEIEYHHDDNEGGCMEMSLGGCPKELRYIGRYARASSKRCRDVVRSLSVKHFGLDSMVWTEIENLEFRFNNWYPFGSADETFGLTITSREIVEYHRNDAADGAKSGTKERRKSSHERSSRELHDIAPTIRIIFPVNRIQSAGDKDNEDGISEPLVKFVEEVRSKLSEISTSYGQFAILIFWGEENMADWFGPEVVYKPTGDGEKYTSSTEGCGK